LRGYGENTVHILGNSKVGFSAFLCTHLKSIIKRKYSFCKKVSAIHTELPETVSKKEFIKPISSSFLKLIHLNIDIQYRSLKILQKSPPDQIFKEKIITLSPRK